MAQPEGAFDNVCLWLKTEVGSLLESVFNMEAFAPNRGGFYLAGFPRRLQLDKYSCGIHCARAILEYFQYPSDPMALELELGTDGVSVEDLARVFRRYRLATQDFEEGILCDVHRGLRYGLPVLVGMDPTTEPHWAVAFGWADDTIYLMDPSIRRLWGNEISHADFLARWDRTGAIIDHVR